MSTLFFTFHTCITKAFYVLSEAQKCDAQIRSREEKRTHKNTRRQGMETSCFDMLPDEAIFAIFAHVHPREVCTLQVVCSRWRQLVNDNLLWCDLVACPWLYVVLAERFCCAVHAGRNGASSGGTSSTQCKRGPVHGRLTSGNDHIVRWSILCSYCACTPTLKPLCSASAVDHFQ